MPSTAMGRDIAQQPAVLHGLLDRRARIVADVRNALPTPLAGISLIARGSSANAGVYARYLLEPAAAVPVTLAAPSMHTLYGATVDHRGWLVVAASQSGHTPDIVASLVALQGGGAVGVALTNDVESPLAKAAQVTVDLGAGVEEAVPATKTFTAELAAFAFVCQALGMRHDQGPWQTMVAEVVRAVADFESLTRLVGRLTKAEQLLCIGRGPLLGVALEVALKLRETAGLHAVGYSAAEFLHGPIAAVDAGTVCLLFGTRNAAGDETTTLAEPLRDRGADVLILGDAADDDCRITPGLPEWLAALPLTVRGQQLALLVAQRRGRDPDRPAGLAKVTRTR
jgi:glutamine---fructose-6-phosphate transaminase (isomerizing)